LVPVCALGPGGGAPETVKLMTDASLAALILLGTDPPGRGAPAVTHVTGSVLMLRYLSPLFRDPDSAEKVQPPGKLLQL
jgi:hypothetical protein